MQKFKLLLKKIIPRSVLKPLLPMYHWVQALAAQIVTGFPARGMKVIAVTGTNGKTTTVALIGSILEAAGHRVGISSTAFYKIGDKMTVNDSNMTVTEPLKVAKLLRKMRADKVDWVVLETTSHALAQHRTLGIPVDTAVMTNLTQDHLDYHGTMKNYAKAKGKLFAKKPRNIVLSADDEWYDFFNKYPATEAKIAYGTDETADSRLTRATMTLSGSELTMMLREQKVKAKTHLVGKFNAYNTLAAAATAELLGVDREAIINGLAALKNVPGRMDMISSPEGFRVIVDYAHTADALKNVLETLRGLSRGRIIVVFGATGDRDKTKRPKMGAVVSKLAEIAIVTDDDPYTENPLRIREEVMGGMPEGKGAAELYEIGDRRGAITKAFELARRSDVILVAGLGHQNFRVMATGKEKWNDRQVIEELLAAR